MSCARQGDEPALAEDELRELLGHNVMPLLRLLYAQAAASCSALSRALSCSCPKMQVHPAHEPCSLEAVATMTVIERFRCLLHVCLHAVAHHASSPPTYSQAIW